ncbi:MAG: pentapeptide repeat-containing protein, partial [Polyangiaceae bacterium]|nr:pentapeptide repeat-containing protein [Polyangiaceae bacterium]
TGAKLNFADFSHADVSTADFSGADLSRANLHNVRDQGALWGGASLLSVKRTDVDRLEAEAWQPPELPRQA